ncbi:MAG: hypothetical protein PSN35_07605, partial [Candidatus Thioglobus sp.]|uniref:hypothetical protein n=1 Tax=Candidatus Thioglobus sp. TaxID=2026721 RepID=UPI00261EFBE0
MSSTKYFITNANGFFINWYSPLLGIETRGQLLSAAGGLGDDAVYVGEGTTVDATGLTATAGNDVIYLTGDFDDYTQSNQGPTYTLTREVVVNGETFTESVKFIASNGDKIVFADGSLAIGFSDLPNFPALDANNLDRTETTPPNPLDSSIPAVVGDDATKVFITDSSGVNIAAGIRGSVFTVAGGTGDDTVYVGVGTIVNAAGLTSTTGNDSIYLEGQFSDYSQSNVGPTYTMSR